MVTTPPSPHSTEAMVRVIQTALTPAFILAGLASLLNVLSVRLGRVSDRVDRLADQQSGDAAVLRRLRVRSQLLDSATAIGSLSGVVLALAVFAMFFAALTDAAADALAYGLFIGALACLIVSLLLFIAEVLMAGHDLRRSTRR